jgi:hypothetical protein
LLSCLTASEKAVKLAQLGRGSGRQRPNECGLPHLLSNEQREAQGAVRLEFNVSRFLAHSFVFFCFRFVSRTVVPLIYLFYKPLLNLF